MVMFLNIEIIHNYNKISSRLIRINPLKYMKGSASHLLEF